MTPKESHTLGEMSLAWMSAPRTRAIALASAAVAGPSCAPAAVDEGGQRTGVLYDVFSGIAAVVFVVTAGLILWSIARYRRRPGDEELPVQTHANVALEVVWFVIPQLIVVFLFLISVGALGIVRSTDDTSAEQVGNEIEVGVQGFQWGWSFDFGTKQVLGTAQDPPEIHLPVGVPIIFDLRSEDVIHSFYVPRFLTKRDVVPGHDNQIEITITTPGTYEGKCAEFCGLLHGAMNFTIVAVAADDFADWLEEL